VTEENPRADWQTRSLAFLIDLIIYVALFYGLGGLGHFLAMLYILFRDGIFSGQSIGKKVMGIQVVNADGRVIHFVDSSFRNVLFLFYVVFPVAILVETIALIRNPEHQRLGDRIAGTRVVRKEAIAVLA
jgi:uncharacterized RDD family membrane protein YckC